MNLSPLFNRNAELPADGWFHVVPLGEFPHSSGVVQVIDDRAAKEIVNRFAAKAATPNFAGLHVGEEHFYYDTDKSTQAFGWAKQLQNRADGVWAQIEWTDLGKQAIEHKRFKFVSPVWDPAKRQTEVIGNREGKAPLRLRPLEIDTLGLTNNPNLRGMVPLTNRAGSGDSADQTPDTHHHMKSVATKLGLQEDASEASILQAVTTLQNRAESAERELAPLKNRNTELEARVQKQAADQVEADLAPLLNRTGDRALKPEVIASFRKQLLANRDEALPGYLAFVAALGQPAGTAAAPLTNRSAAGHPGSLPGTAEDAKNPDTAAGFVAVIKNRAAGTSIGAAIASAVAQHPNGHAAWLAAGQPSLA